MLPGATKLILLVLLVVLFTVGARLLLNRFKPVEHRAHPTGPSDRPSPHRTTIKDRWVAMRAPGQRGWYWRWPIELAVLAALDFAYESLRNLVPNQRSRGDNLASKVNALEAHLHWSVDLQLNHALITHAHLAQLVNDYYSWLFLPVTLTVLTWVFLRHQRHYRHVRTVLVVVTLIALTCFYLYPMAPPRLLPGGSFIDTSHAFPTWGSWSTPTVADHSNQYAAMPSLHCAWALWNGLVIAHLARRTWVRALGILYPVLTYLAVIATANHFTIDALGGLVTTAAVFAITTAPRRSLSYARHEEVTY